MTTTLALLVAPAIVMAPRPSTMKAAIVIAVFRDNNCSILRVCSCSWQRNCDRTQSSQGDKKCAHVFLLIGDYPPLVNERADDVPFFLRLSRSGSVTSAPPCPTTTVSGLLH